MNLAATIQMHCYGTSEGVSKAWDERGRGKHLPMLPYGRMKRGTPVTPEGRRKSYIAERIRQIAIMRRAYPGLQASQKSQPLARYGRQKLVTLDFDDTLAEEEHGVRDGKFGKLNPEAIKLAKWLNRHGYGIVVLTARTQANQKGIKEYLAKHGIKVLEVTSDKPPAAAYVDDRALTWNGNADEIIKQLRKQYNRG